MKKEEMDLWLKTSLEGHGSPVPIGGWKGLHQSRKKKKNKFLFWISAACLILFAGLALWKFGTNPVPDQLLQVEMQVPEKHGESSREYRSPEIESLIIEVPSKQPTDHPTYREKKNESVDPTQAELPEVQGAPMPQALKTETLGIGNRPVSPIKCSMTEGTTTRLKEKSYSRFSNRISLFVEAGLAAGRMRFAEDANLATYRPSYSSYLKSQDLRQIDRSFGFVAYYQGLHRWSLGTGLGLSHKTASGKVNYAYYESVLNLVNLGEQNWPDNTLDQAASLSHETTINSWSIYVPLRFHYQPFALWGPFVEIGACYAYNLSNQGEWLDPETLVVERSRNLVPKHLFSAELSAGYQWKFSRTSISINYRFSPWSSKYAPIQGRMGTNLHGFHIQVQMPH